VYVTVFNPSDSPVLLDEQGRSVGGGEWSPAETTDSVTKAALDSGGLLKVEAPEGDFDRNRQSPQAIEAFERTSKYAERGEQLEGKDKAALRKIADKHGMVEEGDDPKVADLRRRLVESDVELTTKQQPKKSAASEPQKDKE
jgi:hypothetical protein